MPSLNRVQRCTQVLRWAESLWPSGKPCVVKFPKYVPDVNGVATKESKTWHGVTYRERNSFVIHISLRNCLQKTQAVETLIHEYVHAYLWPPAKVEFFRPEHGPLYWTAYGEIMDAFMEGGGSDESKNFPFK